MRSRTVSLLSTHVMGKRGPLMKSLRTILIIASLMVIASIIVGCALLDGGLWTSTTPQLEYSEDLSAWGINYFLKCSANMTETPPETGWIEPEPRGRLRLYGIIPFEYGNDVRVIFDELDDVESVITFAFGGDKDFRNSPLYELYNNEHMSETISFSFFYSDGICEQYGIRVACRIASGSSIGTYRLHYYRGCARGGLVAIDGKERLLAIEDYDTDGVYSDLDSTNLLIDMDGDGIVQREEERVGSTESFELDGTYYIVDHITEAGTFISFQRADMGIITGYVHSNNKPIREATIVLADKYETKTDINGQFSMEVPEGDYSKGNYGALFVKAPGYIPLWKRLQESVDPGRDLILTVELKPATGPKQGYIILEKGDSYHFLAGEMHRLSGGDFFFSTFNKASFSAHNPHQRGVVDLGVVNAALCTVEVPSSGYTDYGVEAIVGHTYVSLAKGGEEGHYIVFKVIALTEDSVSLGYYYR